MDISEACCSQGNSRTRKQSRSTSERGWEERLVKVYLTYDTDKDRKRIQDKLIKLLRELEYNIVEPGRFAKKHYDSAPYHLFFSRIDSSKETYDQRYSITFPEILDKSLGNIVNSLHLTFTVDVTWLCVQYMLASQCTDMTILYENRANSVKYSNNITTVKIKKSDEFGCHHTKITILQYDDGGIRVVVSTANLSFKDWENDTQGLWISPHLPSLPEYADPSEGESETGFKKDLGRYLSRYKNLHLQQWINIVKKTNFRDVNVFFIASFPGYYNRFSGKRWGHRKLSRILSNYVALLKNASQWSLVAQSSSVGSFGSNRDESWLSKEIIPSMSPETKDLKSRPKFQFIYPTFENYKQSYDYSTPNCCLSYPKDVHFNQKWITSYLYQWRAKRTERDRAMPHIKSYTRISPKLDSILWFVLTSANLSKAGWGVERNGIYRIANYEAGVVFLPQFITNTKTFPINEKSQRRTVPIFPILYDLPLHKYNERDSPYMTQMYIQN